jgi:hypothetical protein
MPLIAYSSTNFRADALAKIEKANEIIMEYRGHGLDLTLRQLYYQFVSRGLIPNNDREYKKLGSVIADGRESGLIDWNAIVDRTRYIRRQPHWESPHEIVAACASQFNLDKWEDQPKYVEVWIEKDALIGVIEGVCQENDVPFLACRGYASASEVWNAGRNRMKSAARRGKDIQVFYLGDHDPSGIDMTRDVRDRLRRYAESDDIEVTRLALNMDQVEEHEPPPNPTKMTDSRASWYVDQFGDECWELDALDPILIRDLIQSAIDGCRDEELWNDAVERQSKCRSDLEKVAGKWDSIVKKLK